jgi:phage repressor protein C with HTH and peptisase S24 domain
MRDAGYNPRSLSLAADLGITAVRDILDGRVASPRYATLSALAKTLGVSVEYIAGAEEARPSPTPPMPIALARDFPVFAAARGGEFGSMVMENAPISVIARPEPLVSVKSAYGVYVVGESMVPAYEQGDIALVHPGLPPRRGTDVILTRTDIDGTQEVLIKRLVGWTDDGWLVRQYNPARDFELLRRDWEVRTIVGRYNGR